MDTSEAIILAIGDPHIRTKEVEYTDLMIKETIEYAKKLQPDCIVVLGDTLHTHDSIRGNPLTRAVDFLRQLKDISYLVLLIGNHDLRNNQVIITEGEMPEHPFTALHDWDNTLVCDVAKTFTIKGITFCGVPYVPNGKYEQAIKGIDISKIRAFFSHQEFRGVKYKLDGESSVNGDVWPQDRPLNVCGHIHEAQEVAPNLIYVGTPIQQDHGADPDKGLGIFRFPEGTEGTEGIREFKYDRYHLKTTPIRVQHKIEVSDTEGIAAIYNDILEAQKNERLVLTKIVLRGTPAELQQVNKTPLIKDLRRLKYTTLVSDPVGVTTVTAVKTNLPEEARTFTKLVEVMLDRDLVLKKLYNDIFVSEGGPEPRGDVPKRRVVVSSRTTQTATRRIVVSGPSGSRRRAVIVRR